MPFRVVASLPVNRSSKPMNFSRKKTMLNSSNDDLAE
jgi:hypothetical protein